MSFPSSTRDIFSNIKILRFLDIEIYKYNYYQKQPYYNALPHFFLYLHAFSALFTILIIMPFNSTQTLCCRHKVVCKKHIYYHIIQHSRHIIKMQAFLILQTFLPILPLPLPDSFVPHLLLLFLLK